MKLSVVIPTYNRSKALAITLDSLSKQSLPREEYEIIVVNDGSTDDTREVMRGFLARQDNILYFEQKNKGPAAARNTAIKAARGKFIFFTGDDIRATPGLLRSHLDMLEADEERAVIGYTCWDDSIQISTFMDFLMEKGHQFDFNGMETGQDCPWLKFYTSNLGISRKWLEDELFDENFPFPAWEDIEMGYRLTKKGLRIVYNGQARAFHNHVIGSNDFYNKTRQAGYSRVYFYSKFPELRTKTFDLASKPFVLFGLRLLSLCVKPLALGKLKYLTWELNLWYYTALGINQGLNKQAVK